MLGSLTLAACAPQSSTSYTDTRCLDRNLDDVIDIVDAADNPECEFDYDEDGFKVYCPSSAIQGSFRSDFYTVFHDENNSLDFMGGSAALRCDHHQYEITDPDALDSLHERLRMRFSFLPIPD